MKEIKFRAWDRLTKTMFEPMDLKSSYARLNGFGSQGYTLMQYTGLKDKNGKEIYEGDILDYKSHYDGDYQVLGGRGKVVFDMGQYDLVYEDGNFINLLVLFSEGREGGTVVGNIYESPYMLEKNVSKVKINTNPELLNKE